MVDNFGDPLDLDSLKPVVGVLDTSLLFVNMDTLPPQQATPLSGPDGIGPRGLLLQNLSQDDRDHLGNALSESLASVFDDSWQKQKDDVHSRI
jgi:hypothetical protein